MHKLIVLAGFTCLLTGLASAGSFTNIVVPGTANVQTAGGNADPATCCNSNGASTAAVLAITFAAGPNQVLTLSSVTGTVGCSGVLTNGADGTCFNFAPTSITTLNSISGIATVFVANMFLVGVFVDDNVPSGPQPGYLSYQAPDAFQLPDYTAVMALNRLFFIGDGLTGTGSGQTQRFGVPNGATRLFLGFVDGFNFQGAADYYGDNVGALTVSGDISSTVPEPGTLALLPLGAAALWLLKKRS